MAGSEHLPRRRRVLAAALAGYAIVFGLRELGGAPGDGVTFLYVIPIILVANEFGARAGALAGLAGVALFFVWASRPTTTSRWSPTLTRTVSFVLVGVLTGRMADRLRATAEDAAAGARHFELALDLLCTANLDGYLVHLNGAWEETLGWSREELMAKPFVEFVHPDDRSGHGASAAALRSGERTERLLNRYCTKDGGYRWIEWSSSFDPEQGLIYAAARDVTDRREAEQRLREADERFRRSFEDSPVGMALVGVRGDEEGPILEVNEALVDLTGLRREDLVGTDSLQELTHLDDVGFVKDGLARLQRGEIPVLRMEFRIRGLAGQVRWMDFTASVVNGADGEPLYRISQLQDVDARRRGEDQLRHLADHDALSGLFNRRRFHEELQRELERGGRGALMLIDLDKFKEVNDTLGHAAGDAVIKARRRGAHRAAADQRRDRAAGRRRVRDHAAPGDRGGGRARGGGGARARRGEPARHRRGRERVAQHRGRDVRGRRRARSGRAAARGRRGDVPGEEPRRQRDRARRLAARGGVGPRSARRGSPSRRSRRRARCAAPRRRPSARARAAKSQRGAQPSSLAGARVDVDALDAREHAPAARAVQPRRRRGTGACTTAGASWRSSARSSRVNGVVALTM